MVRSRPIVMVVLLLAGVLLGGDAVAGWRCEGRIVDNGSLDVEVLNLCGEPDYVDRRPQVFIAGYGFIGDVAEWYYNGGSQRLIRVLHFRNGVLRRVETAGHGISPMLRGHCQPHDINRGMSKFELVLRCGEPDYSRTFYDQSRYGFKHGTADLRQVDRWIYNFGSTRFSRRIRIENGRIIDVSIGERGGW